MSRIHRSILLCMGFVLFGQAVAQRDTIGDAGIWDLYDERRTLILLRPLDTLIVDVPSLLGHRSLDIASVDEALLALVVRMDLGSSERVLDYLDRAAVLFHREGTPAHLVAGYPLTLEWYEQEEERTGCLQVFSTMGCIVHGRERDGVQVFNLRTELLMDSAGRPGNEARMQALRAQMKDEQQQLKEHGWSAWAEDTIPLPKGCDQEATRRRSRYIPKKHRWLTEVEVTRLDCCGRPMERRRYTEDANAWKVRITHVRTKRWNSSCALF